MDNYYRITNIASPKVAYLNGNTVVRSTIDCKRKIEMPEKIGFDFFDCGDGTDADDDTSHDEDEYYSQRFRPGYFLGHSLSGLILKDAMAQSAGSGDAAVAALFQRLRGAVMFGVPNLGMDNSHWGALVEGQPNEILVQNLSRDNGTSYLRQLDARFQELAVVKKAVIYWAYETLESPTVKVRFLFS
jgi:hypothetical protein